MSPRGALTKREDFEGLRGSKLYGVWVPRDGSSRVTLRSYCYHHLNNLHLFYSEWGSITPYNPLLKDWNIENTGAFPNDYLFTNYWYAYAYMENTRHIRSKNET